MRACARTAAHSGSKSRASTLFATNEANARERDHCLLMSLTNRVSDPDRLRTIGGVLGCEY